MDSSPTRPGDQCTRPHEAPSLLIPILYAIYERSASFEPTIIISPIRRTPGGFPDGKSFLEIQTDKTI